MEAVSVFLKISLIISGSNNRLVCYIHNCKCRAVGFKRFLQSDAERGPIISAPYREHISAQVDQSVFYVLADQIFFQPVRNVSFCDAAQIDLRFRIGQSNSISLDSDVTIINVSNGLGKSIRIRKQFFIVICKVPQFTCGSDRYIKISV